MKKKTIVILSLVSAIISFVWLMLNYFGVIRYIGMYSSSTEKYIANYKKLEKASPDSRVVIIFSDDYPVLKQDIKKLKPVLLSLLDQTVRVNEIALTIPYHLRGEYDEFKDILNIYYRSVKYPRGIGNLVPTLLREDEGDTKIIIVDANTIYGKDFIEDIVENSNKSPEYVIKYKNALILTPNSIDIKGIEDSVGKEWTDSPEWVNPPSVHDWLKRYLKWNVINKKYNENYRLI